MTDQVWVWMAMSLIVIVAVSLIAIVSSLGVLTYWQVKVAWILWQRRRVISNYKRYLANVEARYFT